jgi:hypothetical protein
MLEERVRVERLPLRLRPDPRRVITRFFATDEDRTRRRIERVLSLSEEEAMSVLSGLLEKCDTAHADIADTWREHFTRVESFVPAEAGTPSRTHRLLIGAYFTMDYALEAAALFNPSIIPQVDQSSVTPGSVRFTLSLRAVGEGHLSSIVFRTGAIGADDSIIIDEPPPECRAMNAEPQAEFDAEELRQTLEDMGQYGPLAEQLLATAPKTFSVADAIAELEPIRVAGDSPVDLARAKEILLSVVGSNYRVRFPEGISVQEAVLFPASANEVRGIEDLRLVRFTDDDGTQSIYGTYTAYSGSGAFPTLFEMHGPGGIESHTLMGRLARNKGMALFPRKIGGRYAMSGRVDGENLYLLESSKVHVWNEGRLSLGPKYWWEFSVIGNCGSPIETEEGWLLLTHGVGPMRQYCVGAVLLDLHDPARVVGRLREPLIVPSDDERVGYVPIEVYTSPLQRAARTCELAGFGDVVEVDPDLVEWDYGEYEGRRTVDIRAERPGWLLVRDGCPGGETPSEIAARADRVVARVRAQ